MDPNQDTTNNTDVQPSATPASPNNQPGQYMDIQKPRVTDASNEGQGSVPVNVQPNDVAEEQTAEIPVSESVAEQMDEHTDEAPEQDAIPEVAVEPVVDNTPKEQPEVMVNVAEAPDEPAVATPEPTPETSSAPEANQPLLVANPKPKKSKKPVLVIIIALVIAAGLIAGAVYAYMQTKDQATQTTTQEQQPIEETITPEDIDKTAEEVDQALTEIDDTADFPESAVSEETLGL